MSREKCAVLEQSTLRGIFEHSASHGDALYEVLSSLAQYPKDEEMIVKMKNLKWADCSEQR